MERAAPWSGVDHGAYPVRVDVQEIAGPTGENYTIVVWRPAQRQGDGAPIGTLAAELCEEDALPDAALLRRCFPGMAREVETRVSADHLDAALQTIADTRLAAARDVPLARGRFPLLLLAGFPSGRGMEFPSISEAVASHGYVVASIGGLEPRPVSRYDAATVEEMRSAIRAALAHLAVDDGVDFRRIALGAWSVGGAPAALHAMNDSRVRAFVSFDSALRYAYGDELIRSAPDFLPQNYSGALLSFTPGVDNPVPKANRVALESAQTRQVTIDNLSHGGFVDLYGMIPALTSAEERETFQRTYGGVARQTVSFLDETLK
jgi:dienelactone hydrolase